MPWSSTWKATSSSAKASGHLCRPDVLRRAQSRGHGAERRHAHAGPQLRGAAAAARRRGAADRPGPLLRPKRLPHLQPHGRAGLSAPGGRRLLRRHPAAADRPGHRPAGGRSGTGQPISITRGWPRPEQLPLRRAGAGLLLARAGHRPERPDLLHPPRAVRSRTTSSARKC